MSGREDGVGDRCWVVDASGRTVATLDENCTNRVALDSGQGFVQPTGSIFSNGFNVFSADGQFVWGRKTHSLLVRSVRGLADGTFIAIGEVEKHFEKGRIGKNGKIPDQDEEWVEIRGPVVARFANDGELIWAKSAEDPVVVGGGFFGGGIDENGNAIYGGHFRNVLRLGNHRFDTGGDPDGFMNNGFLVSWDGNGNVKWAKHLASDSGSIVTSIAVSSEGTTYVSGLFQDSVEIDGQTYLENDPTDVFNWVTYIMGLRPDGSSFQVATLPVDNSPGISLATTGELFLHGQIRGQRNFGNWSVGAEDNGWRRFLARLGNLAPTVAEQPESVLIEDNQHATFSVLVTGGEPFELQWRKDGVALEESDRFRGVNTSSLFVFRPERDDEGDYDVVALTDGGRTTSQAASLGFKNGAPVFTSGSSARLTWLTFNQIDEGFVYQFPLSIDDPDGDQVFTWELRDTNNRSQDPIELSLLSITGETNELRIRWPPNSGESFEDRRYEGTVLATDPSGAVAEFRLGVSFGAPRSTQLVDSTEIRTNEDSGEVIALQLVRDDNIHSETYLNPEILDWRVSVQPETLGQASVAATTRFWNQTLSIAFTPAPDAAGDGEVILEVVGSQSQEPTTFSIPVKVLAVNDAPRLLEPVTILGEVAVGNLIRGDVGKWYDPETDTLGLTYQLEWVHSDTPSVDGAEKIAGANNEQLFLSDLLLNQYIALRVSVTDELLSGQKGTIETTVAYSEFRQVLHATENVPDFSHLPESSISGGYSTGGHRPDAFGGDWIREGRRLINLREPDLSFSLNDRVSPPFKGSWHQFFAFGNTPNWIGMAGSPTQSWVFDVRSVLDADQRITTSQAEFSYLTGSGVNFSGDYRGIFVNPEGVFFRLTSSSISDRLYLEKNGVGVATLEGVRSLRANQDVTHVMAVERHGEVEVRDFPSLELLSEMAVPSRLKTNSNSAEWGLSPDGGGALVELPEDLPGRKRFVLLDFELGKVVRDFLFDASEEFVVALPSGERDQLMTKGPLTVSVDGQPCFVIERHSESEAMASLDFVSWKSGELLGMDWIEKGMFHRGDFYHPDRPGLFLYPSGLTPSLLVYDFAARWTVERLTFVEQLLTTSDEPFTDVRTSADGRLILLSNPNERGVGFHPLAKGEVQGVAFEDRNGNGQLDLGLIQSEAPHIIYVIDVSGSVADRFEGSPVGDVNFDGQANTILDAELAAFTSFHRNLIRFGQADDAQVAVVGFSEQGFLF